MQKRLEKLSSAILLIGALIFISGLATRVGSQPIPQRSRTLSSLTARNEAIRNAASKGQRSYAFKTNFIPGIGFLTDPQAYKDSWTNSVGLRARSD
ncbi:hypothetical protein A3A71_02720 [Candidatus Berkelbacteria bacterium RIFCSPLOWO2_01_FULL_50_28]|uniref:Uncharacterized protein n=1 Tax=Candidatus Berkelbacteria bacterium RIFCSPLOWO2_01_FULL_50_28 TaxID=1797471 RepID=A0A1F5EC26_9BACT|nr:MAG: hypothetical protein A2807_02210 [Candidatus Berkelbacteria bacterium RIFCSPHIGHO2_01_FULL_50_36]OGD62623.1 MAG: hypothetical protein A3F39_02800 [Candidatus Berkelbacteria bacterium RIFCSPHIGHO2_12_FULL_50_11]OGD64935.1 MAG: hypothetical protein A3A71_02720 [Candidatus Berkelbacteria bacterium RIFCSPLOWO2_01_FULL_50_28]